jgi:hypothetical protein
VWIVPGKSATGVVASLEHCPRLGGACCAAGEPVAALALAEEIPPLHLHAFVWRGLAVIKAVYSHGKILPLAGDLSKVSQMID